MFKPFLDDQTFCLSNLGGVKCIQLCILQSDCSPQPFVLLKQQGTLRTAFEATISLSPIPNQMIWDAAFNRRLRETVSARGFLLTQQ